MRVADKMQTALESTSWIRFKRAINSKATFSVYKNSMKVFMQFTRVDNDPDQLLLGSNEQIEDSIMGFIAVQKGDGLSSSMINTRLAAIKLFYDMNRRPLAWRMIRRTVGTTMKHKDRAYTREEIQKLLSVADIRGRVIILLLVSTGMRVGAVPKLQKKHIVPIEKYGIYKFIVYEGYGEEYGAFCTPECRNAIDEYFAYRQRYGEKIGPNSPLLRTEFDRNDMREIMNSKPVSEVTISANIRRLIIAAGIRPKTALVEGQYPARIRHEIKALHGFRKFYDTEMTKAGVSLLWVEMLEGHDIKLKESYFKPSENDLLEGNDRMLGYTAAIAALTVSEESKLRLRVEKLEKANEVEDSNADAITAISDQLVRVMKDLADVQERIK